jgi:hypothetical protein
MKIDENTANERTSMTSKIERISELYDAGASLDRMIAELGTDDDTLRLLHSRLGTAMSTLRRRAADLEARKAETPEQREARIALEHDAWVARRAERELELERYREQVRETFQQMSDQALAFQNTLVRGGIDRQELDREFTRRAALRITLTSKTEDR